MSYQIRYVLRAGRAEASPRGEAGATSPGATVAGQRALFELAREGAALIRLAMGGGAELRRAALGYATLLADTAGPAPLQRDGG